uniref:hypothetical protein n=1 Tax=Trichocoleus desertorum TaxID=1481672 RepID=UPI0025B433DC|nr:hypothetical protein [Trichocoleus desertorum]
MKREVVRDFLNLPGIAGVALMDGRSRPYFCGVDQTLNFQQKEALAQGIRQVVETTPDGFESFVFQFTGHQVYIYKLDHGIILLVLARAQLVYADYSEAIVQLKAALQEDITTAIATFRLLASDVTISGQNYWKQRIDGNPTSTLDSTLATGSHAFRSGSSALTNPPTSDAEPTATPNGAQISPTPSPANPAVKVESPPTAAPPEPKPTPSPPSEVNASVDLKELLATLNHLSHFTTQYLGTAVITNYWKSSRPDLDWLHNFQVDRSAHLNFSSPLAQGTNQLITAEQQQWIQQWVMAFIKRCSQVIRDFPTIVEQRALSDRQKQILLQQSP